MNHRGKNTFSSVQFNRSVASDSLRPHESQHARLPCPSQTPGVYSNSCPSSRWCHPAISSSVIPFSFCPQSLPASRSFPMSQLFAWGGQSIGVSASASVLSMNTQDLPPSGWTCWICPPLIFSGIFLNFQWGSDWPKWMHQVQKDRKIRPTSEQGRSWVFCPWLQPMLEVGSWPPSVGTRGSAGFSSGSALFHCHF